MTSALSHHDDDRVVDLALTLDAWAPLHGRLRRIAPEPAREEEFHGWIALASMLSALARDMLAEVDGPRAPDQP